MGKKEKPAAIIMTDGKREIIRQLLSEYDIQTAQDIQEALKDLLGGTLNEMMEAEMSRHLGYEKSERSDSDNARNGYKSKRVNSSYGNFSVEVPQDRKSSFAPQIKGYFRLDRKIIAMYGRGLSTRQISDTIEELYGFDVSDKILPQIQEWQARPFEEVYPVMFIDATHYSVRDNGASAS